VIDFGAARLGDVEVKLVGAKVGGTEFHPRPLTVSIVKDEKKHAQAYFAKLDREFYYLDLQARIAANDPESGILQTRLNQIVRLVTWIKDGLTILHFPSSSEFKPHCQ
jgi:hypothetical protein